MLEELRKKQGLTQQELADKLNVKQSTVSMWESGEVIPRGLMLLKLANELNISTDDILKCYIKK